MDQTGFMLQPTMRRTWAPQVQIPIHYSWDRHDRLSATGALTVSPVQKRLGLCHRVVQPYGRRSLYLTSSSSAAIGSARCA